MSPFTPRFSNSDSDLHRLRIRDPHLDDEDNAYDRRFSHQERPSDHSQAPRLASEKNSVRHTSRKDIQGLSFWHDDSRDDQVEENEEEWEEKQSPLTFVLVVAIFIVISALGWFVYRWATSSTPSTPPLIQNDPNPFKIKPENPGGMVVPHQDKSVYGRLTPDQQAPVERLLPPPEQPIVMAPQNQQQMIMTQNGQYVQQPAQGQPYAMPQEMQGAQQQGMMPPQQPSYPSQQQGGVQNVPAGYPAQQQGMMPQPIPGQQQGIGQPMPQQQIPMGQNQGYGDPRYGDPRQQQGGNMPVQPLQHPMQQGIQQASIQPQQPLQPLNQQRMALDGQNSQSVVNGMPQGQLAGKVPVSQPATVQNSTTASLDHDLDGDLDQLIASEVDASDKKTKGKNDSSMKKGPQPFSVPESTQELQKKQVKLEGTEKGESVKTGAIEPGKYKVQLASLVSQAAANSELNRIKSSQSSLLAGKKLMVQRVDGGQGVSHRVLAGPFNSKEAAIQFCNKMKTQGFGCIIVPPTS